MDENSPFFSLMGITL